MEAIPGNMRHLPVYITETDQNLSWEDRHGSEWVRQSVACHRQRAYAEIDRWNRQPGHQQIRALILYRWRKVGEDRWWIEGKGGVIEDFKRATGHGSGWNPEAAPAPGEPPTAKFSQGQQVHASAVVNVRRAPGYLNKPGDDILGQIVHGTAVTITGFPLQKDGLTWWPARRTLTSGEPVEGWMAEVAPNGTRLLSAEVPSVPRGAGLGALG